MKKCNPPLVVQLLPIFHYSVSIEVLLFFFKIWNVYTKVGTNLWDDLIFLSCMKDSYINIIKTKEYCLRYTRSLWCSRRLRSNLLEDSFRKENLLHIPSYDAALSFQNLSWVLRKTRSRLKLFLKKILVNMSFSQKMDVKTSKIMHNMC